MKCLTGIKTNGAMTLREEFINWLHKTFGRKQGDYLLLPFLILKFILVPIKFCRSLNDMAWDRQPAVIGKHSFNLRNHLPFSNKY